MKLWTKSIIGVGSVGVLGGAVAGGLYGYSKSDASKGAAHYSARGLENNLADFKKVDTYKASLRDPNNTATVLADYDIKTDTIGGKDAQQWIEDYIQKNGTVPPALFIEAGPIEFQNFYPEVILPKDYVNFIQWYSTNVPWTADISSLSFYRIKRGIQFGEDGYSLTLGDYAADKQTTKRIRFIPDSFFQQISASTMLRKFADKPFSKPQLDQFFKDVTETNNIILHDDTLSPEQQQGALIRVYSVDQLGDNEYSPILSVGGDNIFKIDKKAPFLKKKTADVGFTYDPITGATKMTEGDSYAIPVATKIPRLTMWRSLANDGEWKGVDIEWLKYVTHHEYGHMQTMGMVSDSATNPVQLSVSPNNGNKLSAPGAAYDLDELNRYLEARAPQIRAVRVKVLPKSKDNPSDPGTTLGFDYYEDAVAEYNKLSDEEKSKTFPPRASDYTNIAFEYKGSTAKWTPETLKDIFGSGVDVSNANAAPYKIDMDTFLKDIKDGKNPRFFMQTVANLRKFADTLGIPAADVVLMNAFDNMIATTSPHISTDDKAHPVKQMMYMVNDGKDYKWVDGIDAITTLKDKNGESLLLAGADSDTSQNIVVTVDGGVKKTFHINPAAKGNDDKLIKDDAKNFIDWFNNHLVPNLHSSIQGRQDLHSGPTLAGAPELDITDAGTIASTETAFKDDQNINSWLKNPSYSNSADLAALFADYTYLFAEVLTRDWLQMSMVQDDIVGVDGTKEPAVVGEFTKTNGFKYQSKYGNINVQNTGLELYVDPKNFLDEDFIALSDSSDPNHDDAVKNEYGLTRASMSQLYVIAKAEGHCLAMGPNGLPGFSDYFLETLNNARFWRMYKAAGNQQAANYYLNKVNSGAALAFRGFNLAGTDIFKTQEEFDESIFQGFSQISNIYTTNNGWSEDRWLRSSLTNGEDIDQTGTAESWTLYDNNGDPIKETDPDAIKEIIPTEDKLKTDGTSGQDGVVDDRVRGFWNFFLQARGIGSRTVSKIWRVPDRDAFAMWGYIPNDDAPKIKYVSFKNKDTGETIYAPVKTGVDNLFYYEKQADASTKHTLHDDGYTSWTIDFLTAGTWYDSKLQNGNWEIDFVDADHKEVTRTDNGERLMSLGKSSDAMDHKDYITENGFTQKFASVYIQRQVDADTNEENGNPVLVAKNQFPL